jgi:ascorbate-specific PTS system EIIC-type component UlaA
MGMVLVTGAAMIGALALAGLMLIHGVARPIPSTIRTLAVVIGGFLFVVAGAATVSAELAPIESSSTAPR